MANIYDTANQLANDLRGTQQFLALKEAMDAVKADEGSLALFKELDAAQMEIMEAQQTGMELTEEQQGHFKSLNERVSQNTTLQSMLLAEKLFTPCSTTYKRISASLCLKHTRI